MVSYGVDQIKIIQINRPAQRKFSLNVGPHLRYAAWPQAALNAKYSLFLSDAGRRDACQRI